MRGEALNWTLREKLLTAAAFVPIVGFYLVFMWTCVRNGVRNYRRARERRRPGFMVIMRKG